MDLTKKRWFVLVASCLINLCIGSIYAWSVFAAPMAEHLSKVLGTPLTASSLSIVFTIANAVGPITMISGGTINDRFGPKRVILIGGILFGGGMIGSGYASQIPVLAVSYGLGCGLGMGMVYGCTIGNSVKFFPDKRGLIGGIATATYGLSSVIVPPVANTLIDLYGVTAAFKMFGTLFLVVICGASFFVCQCPPNFIPHNYRPSKLVTSEGADKNWRQMLRSRDFYIMIVMLTSGAVAGLMMISQAAPISQHMLGLSAGAASIVVSVLALFNAAGRVIVGYLSDKIGRINALSGSFAFSIVGLVLLLLSNSNRAILFYVGISVIGICFGALMGIFPGFTADQFGSRNNTVNYGIMFIGFASAGLIGPVIMSMLYVKTSVYSWAFLFATILSFLGLLLTFVWRKMHKTSVQSSMLLNGISHCK